MVVSYSSIWESAKTGGADLDQTIGLLSTQVSMQKNQNFMSSSFDGSVIQQRQPREAIWSKRIFSYFFSLKINIKSATNFNSFSRFPALLPSLSLPFPNLHVAACLLQFLSLKTLKKFNKTGHCLAVP